ncbi:MAG: hypothetical protein AAGA58_20530 [Verrucomicrobiota bacterium]
MKPRYIFYLIALSIALPGAIYWRSQCECSVPETSAPVTHSLPPTQESAPPQEVKKLLGDRVLETYATETTDGRSDIRLLHGFVNNALTLSKQADPRHYATNEDLVELLLGENAGNREPLLGKASHALNQNGQLVDRWNSPIIVHVEKAGVLELQSAGPDKTPYTEDDIAWPKQKAG